MTTSSWTIEEVTDLADPRLSAYRDLTDMDLRKRQETEGGFFMAEGLQVIERARRAGLDIVTVLTAPKWIDRLTPVLSGWAGTMFVTEHVSDIAGYRVHRGALAEVRRPIAHGISDVSNVAEHLLVLEDLVDHTNVGLAFRSAAALGIAGVVLSPGCADPLYRRSVKASMGAVFDLPWARATAWPQDLEGIRARHSLVALTPTPTAPVIEQVLRARPMPGVALMVGTEGEGLSRSALDRADSLARIPMDAGIDSLNVAAAIAVACYALRMDHSAGDR